MNYIVLEGFSLYITLILILILVLISFSCLICVIFADRRSFLMRCMIKRLTAENKLLNKANLSLKLRYGELETDEE